MPKCQECEQERHVLVACQLCPLVCCYECATSITDGKLTFPCERFGDRWPQSPTGGKKKRRGEIGPQGRLAPVNPRTPMSGSTNVSPDGHTWGPAG